MVTLTSLYSCNIYCLTIIQEVCTRPQKPISQPQPSSSATSFLSVAWAGETIKGEKKGRETWVLYKVNCSLCIFLHYCITFAKYGLQAHNCVWKSRRRSCWNYLGLPGKRIKNKANYYPMFTSACFIQLYIHKEAEENMTWSVLIRQYWLDFLSCYLLSSSLNFLWEIFIP